MSQRGSGYARKARDLYETPAWVTHALRPHLPYEPGSIWEPACGNGAMSDVFVEWGTPSIDMTDIALGRDFLMELTRPIEAIITNPPYELAQEFCEHALKLTEHGGGLVAMLLRTDFDHAKSRAHLFRDCPAFAKKVVLTKRIAWFVEANGRPKANPSFNHAWYLWDWKHDGPPTIAYGP